MPTHYDPMKSFLPTSDIRLVIMGTMVAINARSINSKPPEEEVFYYNNNRNHFWRVMQHLMEPKKTPIKLSISEKKDFLNKHGIAIMNLVSQVEVKKSQIADPSDTVLFEAHSKNKVEFKKISAAEKKILKKAPIYFTCRSKPGIKNLLTDYWSFNGLPESLLENIHYLATPTRCNPKARSLMWKKEMNSHEKTLKQTSI